MTSAERLRTICPSRDEYLQLEIIFDHVINSDADVNVYYVNDCIRERCNERRRIKEDDQGKKEEPYNNT